MLKPRMGHVIRALVLGAVCTAVVACADTGVVEPKKGSPETVSHRVPVIFPNYLGPKTRIAVLPLGLSKRTARRYPKLVDRQVGLGLHQMIVNTLAETKRFQFVEIRKELVEQLMRQLY